MVPFHPLQFVYEDPAYNPYMSISSLTLHDLREALASGTAKPSELANRALKCSNRNAGQNTFLWQDQAWTMAEAARSSAIPRGEGGPFGDGRSPLWGLPISVKDCFDLAGSPTSCGGSIYLDIFG